MKLNIDYEFLMIQIPTIIVFDFIFP